MDQPLSAAERVAKARTALLVDRSKCIHCGKEMRRVSRARRYCSLACKSREARKLLRTRLRAAEAAMSKQAGGEQA